MFVQSRRNLAFAANVLPANFPLRALCSKLNNKYILSARSNLHGSTTLKRNRKLSYSNLVRSSLNCPDFPKLYISICKEQPVPLFSKVDVNYNLSIIQADRR